jgi:hypothetical protein
MLAVMTYMQIKESASHGSDLFILIIFNYSLKVC